MHTNASDAQADNSIKVAVSCRDARTPGHSGLPQQMTRPEQTHAWSCQGICGLTKVGAVLDEGVHLAPKHRHPQLRGRLQEAARRGQLAHVEAAHAVRPAQRESVVRRHVADRVAIPDEQRAYSISYIAPGSKCAWQLSVHLAYGRGCYGIRGLMWISGQLKTHLKS